jgi:hypothetical protein
MNFDFRISDYISFDDVSIALLSTLFLVLASLIFYTYLYFFYPVIKTKINKKIDSFKKASKEKELKRTEAKDRYTIYLWAESKRVFLYNLSFLGVFLIAVLLYLITGIWFYIPVLVAYIWFLRLIFQTYKEFPNVAKEKLTQFESELEEKVKKEAVTSYDLINKTINNVETSEDDEDTKAYLEYLFDKPEVVKVPTEVKVADFPPFNTISGVKKSVILERKMQFIVFKRDFFMVALNPTKFNLLSPARNKKLEPLIAVGPTKDYFYSKIYKTEYKDGVLEITFKESEGVEPFKLKCSAPISKEIMKKIRDRRRVLERLYLGKVDEVYKFTTMKEHLKVTLDNKNEEENNSSLEENQDSSKEQQTEDKKK